MYILFLCFLHIAVTIFLNKYYNFKSLCRYLALVGALASEADFVFIPEWPPEANWPETMCEKLKMVNLFKIQNCKYFNCLMFILL